MICGAHGHVDNPRGWWGKPAPGDPKRDYLLEAIEAGLLDWSDLDDYDAWRQAQTADADERLRRYLAGIPDNAPF